MLVATKKKHPFTDQNSNPKDFFWLKIKGGEHFVAWNKK